MFSGTSKDGRRVVSGEYVFEMRDTHGIPLSVMLMLLERRGWGFDVMSFIESCHRSPNYSLERCRQILCSGTELEYIHDMIDACIRRYVSMIQESP